MKKIFFIMMSIMMISGVSHAYSQETLKILTAIMDSNNFEDDMGNGLSSDSDVLKARFQKYMDAVLARKTLGQGDVALVSAECTNGQDILNCAVTVTSSYANVDTTVNYSFSSSPEGTLKADTVAVKSTEIYGPSAALTFTPGGLVRCICDAYMFATAQNGSKGYVRNKQKVLSVRIRVAFTDSSTKEFTLQDPPLGVGAYAAGAESNAWVKMQLAKNGVYLNTGDVVDLISFTGYVILYKDPFAKIPLTPIKV
jgi:hypothetical protein